MSSSGRLAEYEWVENGNRGFSQYAGEDYYPYKPIILLHMTVGMALSKSYVSTHRVPPHLWYNVYTGDMWQTQELDLAAKALYQPQFGYHWTNKHAYILQTELVGVPVVSTATYSDDQCYAIARDVVVPQVLWLRERGLDVDLTQVRYHENTSGSASEYWHGRFSEQEMADFNGLCAHIDTWGNDHWDCSAEKMWLIAKYARQILGEISVPLPTKKRKKLHMEGRYRMDPKDRTQRVTGGDGQIQGGVYNVIDLPACRPGGFILFHPVDEGGSSLVKVLYKGHNVWEGWTKWNMAINVKLPEGIPDADGHTGPGLVSVLVAANTELRVVYEGP